MGTCTPRWSIWENWEEFLLVVCQTWGGKLWLVGLNVFTFKNRWEVYIFLKFGFIGNLPDFFFFWILLNNYFFPIKKKKKKARKYRVAKRNFCYYFNMKQFWITYYPNVFSNFFFFLEWSTKTKAITLCVVFVWIISYKVRLRHNDLNISWRLQIKVGIRILKLVHETRPYIWAIIKMSTTHRRVSIITRLSENIASPFQCVCSFS